MAEVLAGTAIGAEGFARRVAIKRVRAERSQTPGFAALFIEEARIASQLCHPNVVSVLDFDRDPEGRLFLVMELVEGKDLAALCEGGPLPPAIASFVTSEILRGLGYAHALPHGGGYVHRDLSPHNVLVSWEGAVKVSDFGIAKALEEQGAGPSGVAKGKPGYMSPEQVNGEPLDGRSDLFAAGILLWEGLVGKRLFAGAARETFAQILFRDVPPPSRFAAGVAADLEAVAMRLLARDREARYPTAAAAIDDLARCADHPRDGRGELVRWLAHRFPAGARGGPPGEPPVQATGTASGDWSLPR
jgi:serine/threonine-protein kinase